MNKWWLVQAVGWLLLLFGGGSWSWLGWLIVLFAPWGDEGDDDDDGYFEDPDDPLDDLWADFDSTEKPRVNLDKKK